MPTHPLFLSMVLAASAAGPIRHDVADEAYRGDPADYPAVFGIYKSAIGAPDCIATLIDPRWAVTAAHCTKDEPLVEGLESDGGYAVEIAGRSAVVVEVVRYDEQVADSNIDLALLRLLEPVSGVAPERLYEYDDELGRTVIMPGWGDTGDGLRGITDSDGVFRVTENRIDAVVDGWLIWRFDDPRSEVDHALALEGISGPGDSGGPAFVVTPQGRFFAGVGSGQRTYGRPEGVYGAEEYFVRVSAHVAWIRNTIAASD